MLSKNNQVLARHAKADHQQRWALRKLTIGVASVLLGGTLLVINGTPVAADQVNPENATAVKSGPEISNTKQDAENAVTLAPTASDRLMVNATSGEQSPAGVGAEAILATSAASPAPSDPSVTAPQQPATLASDASGQMQPAVTKPQAPEMGWRKMEDSGRTVDYYVIIREVTLVVNQNGKEDVMPLQVWDTLDYLDEEENDKLPKIHFDPIEVTPITGAIAPKIPAISQSVHLFLNMGDIEKSYAGKPVQRIGEAEVTPLPDEPEYDEIYNKIYDQYEDKVTEYEKKIEAEGGKFGDLNVLFLKEKYQYYGVEEKTITRTINVHLPNGEVQTTKQPVTLTYTYSYTKVKDKPEYSEWTTDTWERFTAPEQEGYTASQSSVDEAKVTSESLDAVVDIYYRADEPAVVEGQEEKIITRTINVHLPNGEVQTTKQPVTLVRQYTSVAGSDEKNYGPWNTGQWDAFTAPEQTGYTALPGSVDEVEVTSESLDAVVDIYYRADEPAVVEGQEEKTITRTINVHLPNGEVQTTTQPVTLERKYTSVAGSEEKKYGPWTVGRWESFTAPEQTGYTALPGSVAEVEVTSESLDAVVDIYYRADEAVIESGQEEKTITRTINVHLPNGEVQTTTQPVTLVREYTGVAGSDEKNYGPWNTGQWNAFTAPELAGYTAMPGSVASVEVTSESLDVVVDIYYRINIPPKVEVGPDPEQPTTDPDPEQPTTDPDPEQPTTDPDPEQPTTDPDPEQPTTDPDPEQPTTDPDPEQPMTDPDPEQPTTDPDPEQPTTDPDPEQPTTDPDPEQPTTDPDPEQPTTDPDPEQPTTDPDPEQPTTDPDPEQPIGHSVAPATVAPDQQANLPQTGNATSSLVALIGATLATFLGSLLLLGKRKR